LVPIPGWVLLEPDSFGPGIAVVVLGLASSVAFGFGDFGGGWTSRRAPVLGVSLVVQLIGVVLMVGAAVATREAPLAGGPLVLAALAGSFGVGGIVSLYHGLAVGRMGVVAPVTGVLAASVPVAVGVVLEGPPPVMVDIGIGLAFVAVVLVSRAPSAGDRRSGLEFAVLAGLGIGAFTVFLGLVPEGHVFWPLAVVKVTAAAILVLAIATGRRAWRVPRRIAVGVVGVGIADMAGNGLFLLAAQAGQLAVASVLSSLYPVTTVILAAVLLREPISRSHSFGIAVAIVAIVLIGTGAVGA
jgi:drug/metabolite transporter (DMT)-like permease